MGDTKTFDLFQEVIADINEIRDSMDMEEVNESCYDIEQKWKQLQEKYSKLSCVYLYLGCPYKKNKSRSSNLPTNQIQNKISK